MTDFGEASGARLTVRLMSTGRTGQTCPLGSHWAYPCVSDSKGALSCLVV